MNFSHSYLKICRNEYLFFCRLRVPCCIFGLYHNFSMKVPLHLFVMLQMKFDNHPTGLQYSFIHYFEFNNLVKMKWTCSTLTQIIQKYKDYIILYYKNYIKMHIYFIIFFRINPWTPSYRYCYFTLPNVRWFYSSREGLSSLSLMIYASHW